MQAATKTSNGGDVLEAPSPATEPLRRMHRSRSMEDLSTEQFSSMADTTVVIFLEYVRNKTSARPARDHALMAETDRLRKRDKKKGFLRRLQSEPNGPGHGGKRPNDKFRARGPADGETACTVTELPKDICRAPAGALQIS